MTVLRLFKVIKLSFNIVDVFSYMHITKTCFLRLIFTLICYLKVSPEDFRSWKILIYILAFPKCNHLNLMHIEMNMNSKVGVKTVNR